MRQVYINQFEKIMSDDINSLQLAAHKSLFDDTLYNFFQQQNGVLGSNSFNTTYVSALVASLSSGIGFYYDSTQIGFNPCYRMISSLGAAIPLTFGAANTQDRIDLICLAPNFAVTASALRWVKTGGTGPIVQSTINKTKQDTYTLQIVAGTPGVTPTVPATPAGYIAIAQAYIHANIGMSGQSDITDVRNFLSQMSISSANHRIATGITLQAQLDALDNAQMSVQAIDPGLTPTKNISKTLLAGDCGKTFLVNSANGAMTFNLPASPPANFWFRVKDIAGQSDTNVMTLHRAGSENIEGLAADFPMASPFCCLTFVTDGASWFVIGRN